MNYTLFSDFTCVECYALNEFLVARGTAAYARWKWVQGQPSLPPLMTLFDYRARAKLEAEIEEVRRRAPALEIAVPQGNPNTSRAIVAAAAVMRFHAVAAAAFRTAVFRAYWLDGTDLSLPAALQRLADAAHVPRVVDLDHPEAEEMAEAWELDWSVERLGGVPRVIRSDGKILWGLKPEPELIAYFQSGTPTARRSGLNAAAPEAAEEGLDLPRQDSNLRPGD